MIIKELVAIMDGKELNKIKPNLRNIPEIVQEAVKMNGNNLKWADPELRKDPTIVLMAVRTNGMALQ